MTDKVFSINTKKPIISSEDKPEETVEDPKEHWKLFLEGLTNRVDVFVEAGVTPDTFIVFMSGFTKRGHVKVKDLICYSPLSPDEVIGMVEMGKLALMDQFMGDDSVE